MGNQKVAHLRCGLLISMVTVGCVLSAIGVVVIGAAFYAVGGVLGALWLRSIVKTAAADRRCEELRSVLERSERHCLEVLRKVIYYVEARDPHWGGHSKHVGELSERIARELSLPDAKCAELRLAGQLHDIGLFAVSDSVLSSRKKFGVSELDCVKKHSEVSYEVLKPLDCLSQDILMGIRHHHERMNGTGYPAGIAGEKVPIEARIIAVADSYDAMTHDRPYRDAMDPMQVMSELRRCTPAGYDRQCVDALARTLKLTALEADTPDPAPVLQAPSS